MTAPIATPKDRPNTVKGIEIVSHATEKLRAQQICNIRATMEDFYKGAGLSDIMFLNWCLLRWYQDHRTITRRCLLADIILEELGESAEKYSREEIEIPRQ